MRLVALTLAITLAACQSSPSDIGLIQKAQRTADMPSCASLRVIDASQVRFDTELFRVNAEFAATPECMADWRKQVDAGDWRRDHHGWWYDSGFNMTISLRRNFGAVTWYQRSLEPNVRYVPTVVDRLLDAGGEN